MQPILDQQSMHLQTPKTEVIITVEFFNVELSIHSANLSLELCRFGHHEHAGRNGSEIRLWTAKISQK